MARDAKEILKECGAFLEGHFLLSSGVIRALTARWPICSSTPKSAARSWPPVAEQLKAMDVDVFVGPAMGGIVYAYELARQCGKRAIFTERVDNQMTLKRFAINPGERCVIAEDVVTTGVSSLETKRVIEEAGGVCLGIVCVVDRTTAAAPSPHPDPGQRAQAAAAQLRAGRMPDLQGRQAAAGAPGAAAKCRKRRSKRFERCAQDPQNYYKAEREANYAGLSDFGKRHRAGRAKRRLPGHHGGRGRVRHRYGRFPGNADRPELLRPDHHPDLPADRQLRLQQRGYGKRAHLGARLHRARSVHHAQQLPL